MSTSQPTPPTTAASESMQYLKGLMKKKTDLETQIEALSSTGSTAHIGESLVDAEGFPRADVDVHGARLARQSLAQLQTDHVAVMKEIEKAMFALHAEAKRNKQAAQQSTPSTSASTTITRPAVTDRILPIPPPSHQPTEQKTAPNTTTTTTTTNQPSILPTTTPPLSPLDAFFLVDQVYEDSPAQSAGLRIGDKVLQFGSVVRGSGGRNEAMRGVVGNSVGRRVRVVVYRVGEGIVTLQLIPQRWSGQGLLGCHLADI